MILPSGTVTFLFTDIEGSTKLWEQHPEAMRVDLARHDELLRQAIEANKGYVFKTVGDAFCAAFATAFDALNAALTSHLLLLNETWEQTEALRVRMALHTGEAQERDGDYFGPTLNRVARLQSTGYGQQTLLSQTTYALVRDSLPPNVTLQDLGLHRLKDLQRPEQVFQLNHPALPNEFPPLKSLDNAALPNNLPQQVTSFIGRENEMAEVKMLLGKTRLLTLTGSGGCGKTRLSLQVAAEVLENYPQGVWFAELASLSDPVRVSQSVAQVFNVTEEADKPLMQTLVEALKPKRLLLVLDNCEHVLAACAQLVNTLIRACPHLQVLASSREGLGIAGELTYRIPSLSLPDRKQPMSAASVSQYEAVQLFIERALFHLPSFAVTNQSAPALASICHRLDGIPLAIELASARVRSLSVEEINRKLDNCFRLLTGGSRTALPRQQTLRALIDWSYGLLNDQEKALLCRLSVFAGGWTLEAAEGVGTGELVEEWEMLDLLTSLVDKSLVVTEPGEEHTRYYLLETVRQYARDRLVERGEGEIARTGHQAFFLAFAEGAEPHLAGPEMKMWLHRLEREHDNLRAALEWGRVDTGETDDNQEVALRIAGAVFRFWSVRGYCTEGRTWLADMLERVSAQTHLPARAKALGAAGELARGQGDFADARSLYQQSLLLYRALENGQGIAFALLNLGILARIQGDYVAAQALFAESLTLFQTLGNKWGIARSLSSLGIVARNQGDIAAARSLYEQCLALYRELGDTQGIAAALTNMGNAAYVQGDCAAAQALYEQGLALFRELGDKQGITTTLGNLSAVAYDQGDYATARAFNEQSLALYRELEDNHGITMSLGTFAHLACVQQQEQCAATLWGAAEALREAMGSPLPPSELENYDQQVAQVRNTMGENAFATAWAQGRAMTLEQAIEYALSDV